MVDAEGTVERRSPEDVRRLVEERQWYGLPADTSGLRAPRGSAGG